MPKKQRREKTQMAWELSRALMRFENDVPSMETYQPSIYKKVTALKDSLRIESNRVGA